MHWYVAFVDESNKEIMFKQSDFFFFSMSVCVRWYSIVLPSGFRIKQLHFYAATPVFFDEKGHVMHNRLVICLPLFTVLFRFQYTKPILCKEMSLLYLHKAILVFNAHIFHIDDIICFKAK